MRKWILKLVTILLLIWLALVALTTTTSGLYGCIKIINVFLPGNLHVDELQGDLLHALTATRINYQSPSMTITSSRIEFSWHWQDLWHKQLTIKQLLIDDLSIQLKRQSVKNKPETTPKKSPVTWAIQVQQGQLHNLQLFGSHGQNILTLKQCDLHAEWRQEKAFVDSQWQAINGVVTKDFSIQIPKGQLKLIGIPEHYQLQSDFDIAFANSQQWFDGHIAFTHIADQLPTIAINVRNKNAYATFDFDAAKAQGQWQISIPALRAIVPQANGVIQSSGTIKHNTHQSQVNLRLTTRNLTFADSLLGSMQLQFDLQGNLKSQTWLSHLTQLDFKNRMMAWRLRQPALVKLTPTYIQLSELCMVDDRQQVCLAADINRLADTKYDGMLNITMPQLVLPPLGIRLHDSNLQLQLNANNTVALKGILYSDTGHLRLAGKTDLNQIEFPTTLDVDGKNFQLLNTAAYKIQISPQLQLSGSHKKITLKGKIFIPKASLVLNEINGALQPSKDIVYVDRDKPVSNNISLFSHVELMLGDDVNINLLGLRAKLGGKLTIIDKPKQPTSAHGQLTVINGSYQAYGQDLQIQHGRLFFLGGPIDNPGLDIQAARILDVILPTSSIISNVPTQLSSQTTRLIVGIKVQGTASRPQINLFAEPPILSDTDMLSYLVLGRPQSQATTADARLLLQALSALNPNNHQAANIVNQIQTVFGLDELSINTKQSLDAKTNETIETTALVLGKRLSPRLYLDYIVDLTDQSNALQFRYKLGKNWMLQTQAGTIDSGIDLFYTWER